MMADFLSRNNNTATISTISTLRRSERLKNSGTNTHGIIYGPQSQDDEHFNQLLHYNIPSHIDLDISQSKPTTKPLSLLTPIPANFTFPPPHDLLEPLKRESKRIKLKTPYIYSKNIWFIFRPVGYVAYVPSSLRQHIITTYHDKLFGHAPPTATSLEIEQSFFWPTLRKDVSDFIQRCTHCAPVLGPKRIDRPYGSTQQGFSAGEYLVFDWAELENIHILIIMDTFSRFINIYHTNKTSALFTAKSILQWCSHYSIPKYLGSDRGTEFVNEVIDTMKTHLHVQDHFLAKPYHEQSRGRIERTVGLVKQTLAVLCSHFKLPLRKFYEIIPIAQSYYNNRRFETLGELTPADFFLFPTTHRRNLLHTTYDHDIQSFQFYTTSDADIELIRNLREQITSLWYKLEPTYQRRELIQSQSSRKFKSINFKPGDYVLISNLSKHPYQWNELAQVIKIDSPHEITVQPIIGEPRLISPDRLKFFRFKHDITPEVIESYEDKYAERLNIESVTDVRITMKRSTPKLELQVRYLPNEYQMETILSWQPLHKVYKTVPFLVKRFIRNCSQSNLLDPRLLAHLTEAIRKLN